MDAFSRAAANRSIRTIQTELEFLQDASLLTPSQTAQIQALLPSSSSMASAASQRAHSPAVTEFHPLPPTNGMSDMSLSNEKANGYPSSSPAPAALPAYSPPPPAGPPVLAHAEALYAYQATDAGDLALGARDGIEVLEWTNADWARGRNTRTGQEGIFPRSYVRVTDEKRHEPSSYGNMPMQIAQTPAPVPMPGPGQVQSPQEPGKMEQQGKKFGKKLGNAAIFGAGATIGSNIVNSIF